MVHMSQKKLLKENAEVPSSFHNGNVAWKNSVAFPVLLVCPCSVWNCMGEQKITMILYCWLQAVWDKVFQMSICAEKWTCTLLLIHNWSPWITPFLTFGHRNPQRQQHCDFVLTMWMVNVLDTIFHLNNWTQCVWAVQCMSWTAKNTWSCLFSQILFFLPAEVVPWTQEEQDAQAGFSLGL